MGTSCSSLKKEHKKSIDSSTSIEEKRCTNRSTENPQNLTKKSGPVPCEPSNVTTSLPPSIEKHENSTTKKPLPSSSELRPPSQTTNINYENHLTAPSVTPSPLPSSHTPSPYTTPSANKQLSLTPSGLPNLGIFTNDVRNILIGQRHQFSSPISRIPSNRELNIYLITTDIGRYEILVSKVTEALKLSLPTQKFNISCSSFNLEPFYMYDRSHRYKEICLDSMKYLSDRGYLVPIIILNGKDDHKLLPRTIEEKAFQMILSSCEGQTKQFFQKWYQKDDNQLTSTYVLHKLDEHLKISKEISLSERKEIFKKWSQESAEAIKFITEESQNQDINNLVSSILEIQLEFFSNDRFTGNKKTLLVKLGKLDSLSVKARNAINKIDEKVGSARKLSLSNSDPSALISNDFEGELHNFLLESLRKIVESINEDEFSIEYHKQFSGIEQSLCNELIVQSCHRHKLDQTFIGRESLLSSVQLYLTSEAKKPLIIHGPKGSGKSSLIAKISTLTSTWLPSSVVVYRFAGISEQSLTCEQLLRSVCEQLCILFGENPCTAASIAVDLNNTLKKLLCKPNEERSLVIIIDGIDRFEESKWLDVHSWLNSELSKFVKIIISFTWLIDSRELSLTDMMKELSLEGSELIDCSNISYEDVETIFNGVLTRNDRRITTAQHTCVSNLLKKHLSPRYAHLLSLEVSKIGDAVSLEQLEYLQSEESIIAQQITKIAEMIESPLLVAIITLLMSTKNGLTDFEITAILLRLQPLQDMVYTDASNNFPFSMWFLIYCRMTCLIDQIYAFGTQCLRISSSQVRESANLFCKKWKDVIKLTQQELLNYVSVSKDELDSSKIHLECDAFSNQWPNRRKALEFPYLMIKSDDGVSLFCQHYCFNISWLCFKLYYSDPFHLIEDIELLKLVSKANEETTTSKSDAQKCLMDAQILSDTIKHSAHPLRYHGLQVISQLYSRLSTYFKDPNSSLNKTYPRISNLLKECQQPIVPSLMPLNTQLMAINKKIFEIDAKNFEIKDPSGETDTELHQYDSIHTIKGDHAHVIALSTSRGEISVWNVIREKPIRSLRGINQPKDIRMINKFQAVVLCNRDLKIYDLNEGTMVNKLKGVMNQKMPFFGLHDENYLVALSRNRMYVNLQSLKTGDLETTFKVGEDRFLNSLLVSANGKFCVCGDETQKPFPLLVWDLSNRKLIYDLRIPHHEFITRLSAISDDGHYVVCVSKELNSTSPNFIIVYDLQSGTLFKKWKPDCDTVSITISSQGSCVINGLESTLISVWDLSTGAKRLTLKGHRSPVDTLQIDDRGKTLLSFDSTGRDTSIRLWNLDNGLCLAVFTPDIPLSCCRLMGSGKMVLICFIDSSKLHTLVLRSRDDAHENEMKNLSSIVYGELDNEGKQFDLNNS